MVRSHISAFCWTDWRKSQNSHPPQFKWFPVDIWPGQPPTTIHKHHIHVARCRGALFNTTGLVPAFLKSASAVASHTHTHKHTHRTALCAKQKQRCPESNRHKLGPVSGVEINLPIFVRSELYAGELRSLIPPKSTTVESFSPPGIGSGWRHELSTRDREKPNNQKSSISLAN